MRKTARAIIIDDDKLLVFFRRKIVDGKEIVYYAIPGGHVEDGEMCEDTVIRELKEEMNLDIEIIDYLGKLNVNNQEENYYYAKIVGGNMCFGGEELERNCDENYYEIRWISINELNKDNMRAMDFVRKAMEVKNEN